MISTWPILKGATALVGMLAASTVATNLILAMTITEETPISLKAAIYVGGGFLTVALFINKKLDEAKSAAKLSATASALACEHAESANKIAIKTASEMSDAIGHMRIQLEKLPCHSEALTCPPKPN